MTSLHTSHLLSLWQTGVWPPSLSPPCAPAEVCCFSVFCFIRVHSDLCLVLPASSLRGPRSAFLVSQVEGEPMEQKSFSFENV